MQTASVIIPTYNYARYLGEAVDCALAQTYSPLEVIVVDDGSTDETPEVLARYRDLIRTVRQPNLGPSVARNAGIAVANGDYLAFLDSDDLWQPQKLERQMARFAADPSLGLVHCGVETFGSPASTPRHFEELEGWVAKAMLRLEGNVMFGTGSAVVVPRRVAEEIGGFDPRLLVSEDWDFCYRIATRYRVGYVAEILVHYRVHGRGIHHDVSCLERSMLLALEKAFRSSDPAVQSLRTYSYGRLHRILAGCYFQARRPRAFVRHAAQSLRYDPGNLRYFASYPWRLLKRTLAR
jgi:glycosyltransferase involved in cell wall biosynthesis